MASTDFEWVSKHSVRHKPTGEHFAAQGGDPECIYGPRNLDGDTYDLEEL